MHYMKSLTILMHSGSMSEATGQMLRGEEQS